MEDEQNVEQEELEAPDPEPRPERTTPPLVRRPAGPVDPTRIAPPPLAE